ncbi:extensin family protein [Streptomyces sp. NA04227]|uniref:extensin family protein n=1 Tax=Streptomyces sp. NA04227 TaxID=2742136 RepID=UPI0015912582|nr:extensin family protein [Streptomyces sp. NA04227]QKW08911.1 extensin family protein [Streptomyces sp. NA04227]
MSMQDPAGSQTGPVGLPEADGPAQSAGTARIDRRLFLGGVGAVAAGAFVAQSATPAGAADEPVGALPREMQASSALAMRTFSKIDGTPVYYWRGDRGNTTLRDWRCTEAFYDRLVLWIRDLRQLSADGGMGGVNFLVSAGFYVNKPGQHGAGTAMDLDLVEWAGGRRSAPLDGHHAGDRTQRRRYLAVDATCRRRFRYVLDGWYNSDHHDHIHSDFAGLPTTCETGSSSDTVFVQAMCNNFMGSGLAVDGIWGPRTTDAFQQAKSRLGITGDPHSSIDSWQNMLARIARHGFGDQAI